ncbi:hypothetical protein YC2023_023004 [Brassica napus]
MASPTISLRKASSSHDLQGQRADQHQRKGMDTNGTEIGSEMIPEVVEFMLRDLSIKLTHVFSWPVSNTD